MKGKAIAVLSAVVIAVGAIGGVAFAANSNTGTQKDAQQTLVNQENNSNTVKYEQYACWRLRYDGWI